MKIIDGEKYSTTKFDEYKFRVIFSIIDKSNKRHFVNVYTTEMDKSKIEKTLRESIKIEVKQSGVVHYATKEADDKAFELLKNFLNEQ